MIITRAMAIILHVDTPAGPVRIVRDGRRYLVNLPYGRYDETIWVEGSLDAAYGNAGHYLSLTLGHQGPAVPSGVAGFSAGNPTTAR